MAAVVGTGVEALADFQQQVGGAPEKLMWVKTWQRRGEPVGVGRILLRKYFTGPTARDSVCSFSKGARRSVCPGEDSGWAGAGVAREAARAWPPVPASCSGHWPEMGKLWWTYMIWLFVFKNIIYISCIFFLLNCSGRMEAPGAWQSGDPQLCPLSCVTTGL